MAEKTLGERVRELREQRGLSQTELGKLVDMDPSAVSRIENDRTRPYPRTLRDLARALKVKPDELLKLRDKG